MLMNLIVLFNLLLVPWLSSAEAPNPPVENRIEGRAVYSYYFTDTNYTSEGSSALVGNGSLTSMMGDFTAVYDWRSDWRFFAGMNYAYVETDDAIFSRSNSGLNEIYLGAQNWYEMGPFDVTPQLEFYYPLWRVDEEADDALIGEGAMRTRVGSWIFWPKGFYRPYGFLGFEHRDGGRSFLLPYQVGVKFKMSNFWAQVEYRGFETIVDDSDSDNEVIREDYLQEVNAGSMHFYSVNPSASEVALEGGTHFGDFGLFGGFLVRVTGVNSSEGWGAFAGISWSPSTGSAANTRQRGEEFAPPTDNYDQTLFEDEVKPKPKAKPKLVRPSSRRMQPEMPATPPPAAAPPGSSVPPVPSGSGSSSPPVDIQLQLRRVPPKKRQIRKPRRNNKMDKMMNETERALENAE